VAKAFSKHRIRLGKPVRIATNWPRADSTARIRAGDRATAKSPKVTTL